MVRATHLARLFQTGHETVGGQPDEETHRQNPEQTGSKAPIALRARDTLHTEPEIIVGPQEERANEHRLHDEQPGKNPAHHGDAELLVIPIDLPAEPVASKRQRNQPNDGDKIPNVAHPVIMRPRCRITWRGQKAEGGIGSHDRATEGNVGNEAMQVHWHPGKVIHRLPGGSPEYPGIDIDTDRRGHERGPGVRNHHQDETKVVQQNTKADVHPFLIMQEGRGLRKPPVYQEGNEQDRR